jgi:hypothetical protein
MIVPQRYLITEQIFQINFVKVFLPAEMIKFKNQQLLFTVAFPW